MLRKILIGAAAAVVLLLIVIAAQPATFHVERSVEIAAPPENAYALVNDFHKWTLWSPYEKLDPQMTRTYSGAESGDGAVYAWQGNKEIGEGRMTIEKSTPASEVSIKLEFIKPFSATNRATFTFVPSGPKTKVTWAMDGNNTFLSKAFHLVMDMDKLVGKDFEKGLLAMQGEAERTTPGASAKK
jgi:Polyketide cyclase / dehydrase and lipid transport